MASLNTNPVWKAPNQPELNFSTRTALQDLGRFLNTNAPGFNRGLVFESYAEGRANFPTPVVGDKFWSTGLNDTGISSYYEYTSTVVGNGWRAWDSDFLNGAAQVAPSDTYDKMPNTVMTFGGMTLGAGTTLFSYCRQGSICYVQFAVQLGAGFTVTNLNGFTLPYLASFPSSAVGTIPVLDNSGRFACILRTSTAAALGYTRLETTSTYRLFVGQVSGANVIEVSASATVPGTWAAGDDMAGFFAYKMQVF